MVTACETAAAAVNLVCPILTDLFGVGVTASSCVLSCGGVAAPLFTSAAQIVSMK